MTNPFTNEEVTEVAVTSKQLGFDIETDIVSRKKSFCSMIPKTDEEKKILFKASNSPEKTLKDCINMTIDLVHVYAEQVTISDEKTGELTEVPRIVLIDKDGIGYGCASFGVYNGISKLMQIFGTPDTWKKPLKIVVKQINKSAEKSILTIDIA